MDFSDQERIFGTLLGSVPNIRAKTNGVVIYKGYVVAEFGDTTWADPTYSVAKSMLATVAGIAVRDGMIKNLDAPVGETVKDGGYDSPRNAQITWKHHLQQVSEWEGNMLGKQDNFIGKEAFGEGEMKPREQKKPGTYYEYNDVRINRFALSLLRVFNKPVPDVFRDEVMDPIGASNTWRWIPYHNSWVESERPQGRVGERRHALGRRHVDQLLWTWRASATCGCAAASGATSRSSRPAYVKEALTSGGAPNSPGNGYGYLWWLNTQGKALRGTADQRVFGERRRQQHHHGVARPRPRRRVALAPGQRGRVRAARGRRNQARNDVRKNPDCAGRLLGWKEQHDHPNVGHGFH